MHIPDGFIPLWQCAIYWTIAIVALIFAFRWGREKLDEKSIPLMVVLAAGIFAIMSMNIPIPFGLSGHMVGVNGSNNIHESMGSSYSNSPCTNDTRNILRRWGE